MSKPSFSFSKKGAKGLASSLHNQKSSSSSSSSCNNGPSLFCKGCIPPQEKVPCNLGPFPVECQFNTSLCNPYNINFWQRQLPLCQEGKCIPIQNLKDEPDPLWTPYQKAVWALLGIFYGDATELSISLWQNAIRKVIDVVGPGTVKLQKKVPFCGNPSVETNGVSSEAMEEKYQILQDNLSSSFTQDEKLVLLMAMQSFPNLVAWLYDPSGNNGAFEEFMLWQANLMFHLFLNMPPEYRIDPVDYIQTILGTQGDCCPVSSTDLAFDPRKPVVMTRQVEECIRFVDPETGEILQFTTVGIHMVRDRYPSASDPRCANEFLDVPDTSPLDHYTSVFFMQTQNIGSIFQGFFQLLL